LAREPGAIEDELLEASTPSAADLPDLLALLTDPRVGATLGGIRSRRAVRATLARWNQLWDERRLGPWMFRSREGGAFVGYAGLFPANAVEPGADELLYAIRPDRWSQGFATRMGGLALADACSHCDLNSVVGFTLTTNRASQRVLEKLGFRFEREFRHVGLPHRFYRLPRERLARAQFFNPPGGRCLTSGCS